MKILFVENHEIFARMVTAQFLAGHEVELVPSIARARDAITRQSFDVVLVDYDLDDGKGPELVFALRLQGFSGKILGVSAKEEGNQLLLAAGADGACVKLEFPKLLELLRSLDASR